MSNIVDNYLFLGLPKSGKTTYFSLMAQRLQDTANRTKNIKFLYLPTQITDQESGEIKQEEITSDFIYHIVMCSNDFCKKIREENEN